MYVCMYVCRAALPPSRPLRGGSRDAWKAPFPSEEQCSAGLLCSAREVKLPDHQTERIMRLVWSRSRRMLFEPLGVRSRRRPLSFMWPSYRANRQQFSGAGVRRSRTAPGGEASFEIPRRSRRDSWPLRLLTESMERLARSKMSVPWWLVVHASIANARWPAHSQDTSRLPGIVTSSHEASCLN